MFLPLSRFDKEPGLVVNIPRLKVSSLSSTDFHHLHQRLKLDPTFPAGSTNPSDRLAVGLAVSPPVLLYGLDPSSVLR